MAAQPVITFSFEHLKYGCVTDELKFKILLISINLNLNNHVISGYNIKQGSLVLL